LALNSHAKDSIEVIDQYVEGYRVILWDHAFPSFFRKDANYSKLIPFGENEGTKDVIKRLVRGGGDDIHVWKCGVVACCLH
jgi:hypothetical protein